jgi:hypothetical protein
MLSISFPDQLQALAETQSQAAGFATVSDYLRHLILQEQIRIESSVVEQDTDRLSDYDHLAEAGLQSVYADEPEGLWESCLEA